MNIRVHPWLRLIACVIPLCAVGARAQMTPFPELELQAAPGFEVTRFADHSFADDIRAIAFDRSGHVVVAGPGYVRRLHDLDDNGVCDAATDIANPAGIPKALCYVGNDLFLVGDGGLWRYVDIDGDGRFDSPGRSLLNMGTDKGGVSSITPGPDGSLYLTGGPNSQFHAIPGLKNGDVPPRGGGVLRVKPDGLGAELIADGLFAPTGIGFNILGDGFVIDGDVDSDVFLPWYSQARLFHVGQGGFHGWNGAATLPFDFPDVIDVSGWGGRIQPSALIVYRHFQFPGHAQGGALMADWRFGRVYLWTMDGVGSSYSATPQLILEPTGMNGMTFSGMAVAPDGSLLLSTGGRKTVGNVFRLRWTGASSAPGAQTEVEAVLAAPQPFEAWSRANWEPLARAVGAVAFQDLLLEGTASVAFRLRAIEVLVDVFGGLLPEITWATANDESPVVRARTAWAYAVKPGENFFPVINRLLGDVSPLVQRNATEAVLNHQSLMPTSQLLLHLQNLLVSEDERVRMNAIRLAAGLPDAAWDELRGKADKRQLARLISVIHAQLMRDDSETVRKELVAEMVDLLEFTRKNEHEFALLRILAIALGDWTELPIGEAMFPNRRLESPGLLDGEVSERFRKLVALRYNATGGRLGEEYARFAGALKIDDPLLLGKLVNAPRKSTAAAWDLHVLAALSQVPGEWDKRQTVAVAKSLLGLEAKLGGLQSAPTRRWKAAVHALATILVSDHPALGAAMLEQREIDRHGNFHFVKALPIELRARYALMISKVVAEQPEYSWSVELVELLGHANSDEVRTMLRTQWQRLDLRDAIVRALARRPDEKDRAFFLEGVMSVDGKVARAAVSALTILPRDPSGERLVPLLKRLRQTLAEPASATLRTEIVRLIARQSGRTFEVKESGTTFPDLVGDYASTFEWFVSQHPNLERALEVDPNDDPVMLDQLMGKVTWSRGDAKLGRTIYTERCATCHDRSFSIGPDVSGYASRMSAEHLIETIAFPHRELHPDYRPMAFRLTQGRMAIGLVVAQDGEGYVLNAGPDATVRVFENEITFRQQAPFSIMPGGLIADLGPLELTHLYAYLKTLR